MAVPMVMLFELAVLFCFLHDRRRERRAEDAELADDVASKVDPIPARLGDDGDAWSSLP